MAKRVFRTKKKLSGVPKAYRKWNDWEVGDIVVGQLAGTHKDQYGNTCYIVKVEDAQFSDKKAAKALIGANLVLNRAGQLNKALESVEEGEWIQVTYNGTSEIPQGPYKGTDSHLIEVLQIEEEDGSEDDESDDEEEEYDEDEDDDDQDL